MIVLSPADEHNAALLAHVHPAGWKNPEPASNYNLVVIGAGTAGLVSAAGAAALGAKVALVEKGLLGGDCLNFGCVPSKALLRSARALADLRNAGGFGVRAAAPPQADFAAVMERLRRLRARISAHDSVERFSKLGVDVYLGAARFTGRRTIDAGGAELRFSKAVIATGARAAHPAIPGLADAGFLTNESVFSLTRLPQRLAVIGGGPIGCELAQAFARLGAEVTLLHKNAHLLDREDEDAADIIQQVFLREGIRLELGCKISRVDKASSGKTLRFAVMGEEKTATVDEILIGTGRAPNVDGLELERAGINYDLRDGIEVNDYLQTSNPRVYAAGDVCMRHKFTHAADAAARIVLQNALFGGRKRLSALTIPWCTYTDPEIAHVGLYEREALAKGIAVSTFVRPLKDVDRAVLDGEEEGFVKIHVKSGSDRILGATVAARHAGEMIGEITFAMAEGIGLGALSAVIHPYPTQAEAIRQAADAYNRTRLTPGVKKLLSFWLRWTR